MGLDFDKTQKPRTVWEELKEGAKNLYNNTFGENGQEQKKSGVEKVAELITKSKAGINLGRQKVVIGQKKLGGQTLQNIFATPEEARKRGYTIIDEGALNEDGVEELKKIYLDKENGDLKSVEQYMKEKRRKLKKFQRNILEKEKDAFFVKENVSKQEIDGDTVFLNAYQQAILKTDTLPWTKEQEDMKNASFEALGMDFFKKREPTPKGRFAAGAFTGELKGAKKASMEELAAEAAITNNPLSMKGSYNWENVIADKKKRAELAKAIAPLTHFSEAQLRRHPNFLSLAFSEINNNAAVATEAFAKAKNLTDDQKKEALKALEIYNATDLTGQQLITGAAAATSDPLSYISGGISKAVTATAGKKLAQKLTKDLAAKGITISATKAKQKATNLIAKNKKIGLLNYVGDMAVQGAAQAIPISALHAELDGNENLIKAVAEGAAKGALAQIVLGHALNFSVEKSAKLMKKAKDTAKKIRVETTEDGKKQLVIGDKKLTDDEIIDAIDVLEKMKTDSRAKEDIKEFKKTRDKEIAERILKKTLNGEYKWIPIDENNKIKKETKIYKIDKIERERKEYKPQNYFRKLPEEDKKQLIDNFIQGWKVSALEKGEKTLQQKPMHFDEFRDVSGRRYEKDTLLGPKTSKTNKAILTKDEKKPIDLINELDEIAKDKKLYTPEGKKRFEHITETEQKANELDFKIEATKRILDKEKLNREEKKIAREKIKRWKEERKELKLPKLDKEEKEKIDIKFRENQIKDLKDIHKVTKNEQKERLLRVNKIKQVWNNPKKPENREKLPTADKKKIKQNLYRYIIEHKDEYAKKVLEEKRTNPLYKTKPSSKFLRETESFRTAVQDFKNIDKAKDLQKVHIAHIARLLDDFSKKKDANLPVERLEEEITKLKQELEATESKLKVEQLKIDKKKKEEGEGYGLGGFKENKPKPRDDEYVRKMLDHHFNNPYDEKAWRNTSGLNIGKTVLDKEERELLKIMKTRRDAGLMTDKEVRQYKEAMIQARTGKRKNGEKLKPERVKEIKKKLTESAFRMKAEEMGINLKDVEDKVWWVKVHNKILDFKNSVALNAGLAFNSKKILDKYNKGEDFRQQIADEINKEIPELGVTKDMVKKIFVPSTYGQGIDSAIKNIATRFFEGNTQKAHLVINKVYKKLEEHVPELIKLREHLLEKIKDNKEISFKLPDGVEVKIKPEGKGTGSVIVDGKKTGVKVTTDDKEMGVGILPAFMISIDAYIYRRIQESAKIIGAHDSMIASSKVDEIAIKKAIENVAKEISQNKLGQKILDQIFGKDKVKIGGEPSDVKIPPVEKMIEEEGISDLPTKKIGKTKYQQVDSTFKTPSTYTDEELVILTALVGNNKANLEPILYKNWRLELYMQNPTKPPQGDFVGMIAHWAKMGDKEGAINQKMPGLKEEYQPVVKRLISKIYDEARAKLELNPNTRNRIKGKKQFYEKDMTALNKQEREIYENIIRDYAEKANKIIENKNLTLAVEIKEELPKMIMTDNYPITKEKIRRIRLKNKLSKIKTAKAGLPNTKKEVTKEDTEKELIKAKGIAEWIKSGFNILKDVKPNGTGYFARQIAKNDVVKSYQKLFNKSAVERHKVSEATGLLRQDISKWVKETGIDEEKLHDMLIKKNAAWLMRYTDEELDSIVDGVRKAIELNKEYIKDAARGLGQQSNMVGHWRNNPEVYLREKYPLASKKEIEEKTKKLENAIVVYALGEDGIKWIKENRSNKAVQALADLHRTNQLEARKLFVNEPNNYIFGYTVEHWENKYSGIETRYNRGIVGKDLFAKKIGTPLEDSYLSHVPSTLNDLSPDEIRDWARKNNIKIDAKGFRVVADEKWKLENGLKYDLKEELVKTYEQIGEKIAQTKIVSEILEEAKNESIISATKKKDFVEIGEDILRGLPKKIQHLRYVHKDFVTDYLGKEEHRLLGPAINKLRKKKELTVDEEKKLKRLQAIDRTLRELTLRFKRANTLLSPKSWTNAAVQNFTLAAMSGINPITFAKLHKEAMHEISAYEAMKKEIISAKALGKDVKHLEEKLKKNEFYKMIEDGLAINMLDGEVAETAVTRKKWDKITNVFPDFLKRGMDNALALEGTGTEKKIIKIYSTIDSIGRYIFAKHAINNGVDRIWAIRDANSVFGDMRQLAPAAIEILDKYPLAPFTHWGSQTIPMLAKIAKDHPFWTLTLTGSLYVLGESLDMDTDSYSPVAGGIDFVGDLIPEIPEERTVKRNVVMKPIQTILPGYITKPMQPSLTAKILDYNRSFRWSDFNRYLYSPKGKIMKFGEVEVDTRRTFQKIVQTTTGEK